MRHEQINSSETLTITFFSNSPFSLLFYELIINVPKFLIVTSRKNITRKLSSLFHKKHEYTVFL